MPRQTDFVHTAEAEPHRARTKAILKSHPEVRALIGRNPYSVFIIAFVVSLQVVISYFLRDASWWWVLGVAYGFGAFANHAMFVMMHETCHNLLFKKKAYNRLAGIVANFPQSFPSAESFRIYHIKHHSFQGVHELDADLPSRWEARLINNYFIGKVFWLLLYPFVQVARTFRLKEIKGYDGWVVLNWTAQIAFDVAIVYVFGWKSIAYFFLSFFFSLGLHPIGARWIQEHYLTHGTQETYSYYGILNYVQMDIGHHNEHHDFPSVPWNNLRKLRNTAPEWYNSLYFHKSWTLLFFRFLFDREISLWSRMVRKNRANVPLADLSLPDLELTAKK